MDHDHRRVVSVRRGALTWAMGLAAGAMLASSASAAVDPDTEFGNGFVDEEGSFAETFAGGNFVNFFDAERLDNGKFVAVGSTLDAAGDDLEVIVVRLTTDGRLDSTFAGSQGYLRVSFDKGGSNADYGEALTVLDDGRIAVTAWVTAGTTEDGLFEFDFGAALVGSNGDAVLEQETIDFGGRSDIPKDIAADQNGIYVVGNSSGSSPDEKGALVRLDPDNNLQPDNFSGDDDGKFTVDNANGEAIALRDDGSVVITGPVNLNEAADPDPGVVQLTHGGFVDSNFGDGNDGSLNFDDTDDANVQPRAVAIDRNGRPVIGGWFRDNQDSEEKAFFVRLQSDGSALDENFGNVNDDIPSTVLNAAQGADLFDGIFDVRFDGQDRILFSGITEAGSASDDREPSDVLFGRLESDGTPDGDFFSDGYTTLSFDETYEYARAIVPAGDNRFVAFGGFDGGAGSSVSRSTDTAFAVAGEVTADSVDDGTDGDGNGGGGGLIGPVAALGLALIGAARTRRIISLLS